MAETAVPDHPPATGKPVKPDEEAFNKALAKAERDHKEAMDLLSAVRAKIDLATPSKNVDTQSPTQKRRAELIAEANEIRQKQAGGKSARTSKLDQIKRFDEQIRARVAEQKAARTKVPYKNVDELDQRIADLDREVSSGRMKIVDEKKNLGEISSLRKLRKNFGQFEDQQKQIDELRAKIKEIKDSMDDPEQKALGDRYTVIQTELDSVKAESDEAYKNLSTLRDERARLHADQQDKYAIIRRIKDDHYAALRKHRDHERAVREKARERRRAEQERITRERKKAEAERMLAEAGEPAFFDEIRRAQSLLKFLDPTYDPGEKLPLQADSGLGATALRKVDDSNMKGVRLVRKEDRNDDYLPAVKKGKKGKGNNIASNAASDPAAAPPSVKYSCPPSVMADCTFMGLDPPMSSADVSAVAEKVKAKLDKWKADQAAETEKNVAKAKKAIEKLERDEKPDDDNDAGASSDDANGTSSDANGGDTEKKVDEITAELKETSVSGKKEGGEVKEEGEPATAAAEAEA